MAPWSLADVAMLDRWKWLRAKAMAGVVLTDDERAEIIDLRRRVAALLAPSYDDGPQPR